MSTIEELLDAAKENAGTSKYLASVHAKDVEGSQAALNHALAAKTLVDAAASMYDRQPEGGPRETSTGRITEILSRTEGPLDSEQIKRIADEIVRECR